MTCINLTSNPEQQQQGFVAPNVLSLAQCYAERWWIPLAIYAADTMVGLIVYGRWPETGIPEGHGTPEPGIDYILRLMIDQHYQGRGYGKAAMQALIARVASQPNSRAIEVDCDPDNVVAARLYTNLGFRPTGEIVNGEIRSRLPLRAAE